MEVQKFQIDENPEGRPLKFVVKKYRFTGFPEQEFGTVLLCLHGIGFTKETWEPFLEEIAAADSKDGRKPTIKEAWILDVPNHGESSHLNDQLLFEDPRDVSLQEYARCGQRLLRAGLMKHSDKDRLIVVGHSVGCGAAIWLSSLYHKEDKKIFDGIILIEPPRELFWEPGYDVMTSAFLVEPTKVRRDIWESREAAKAWMVKRAPWKIWDPRVLDTYVKYGLRDLPTVWYPDQKGVTLSAARHHEVFAYNNHVELNVPTSCTPEVCKIMPMHVFVAKRSPLSPDEKEFGWMTEKGITFSILPPKSDHLVIHQLPKEVARDTLAVLDKIPQKVQGRARL